MNRFCLEFLARLRPITHRVFLIFVGFYCVCLPAWGETLHLGTIGYSIGDEIRDFMPLARYLAANLRADGVNDVKVAVAGSIAEMAALMRSAKVDLFIDSAFPSMALNQLAGSKFLLRRWKRGVREYRSLIFTKNDSGLRQLSDLKGKTIAFEEAYSSTGYFFPKVALLKAGLKVAAKKDASDPVAPTEVGYVLSNDDENTMLWVLRGLLIAGATDDVTFVRRARSKIDELRILYESAPMPRQLVSYRQDLAENVIRKLRETLLSMDKSDAGKTALMEFQRTAKFDLVPEEFHGFVSQSAPFLRRELGLK
jgi:phosphonate transport system substrate-binding protein